MSYLENLKKQAQEIKQKEIEAETTTIATVGADVRAQNAVILNDILFYVHGYLKDLVDNLNVIKPENEIIFHLLEHGAAPINIEQVRKTNFRIQEGQSINGNRVVFKYDLYAVPGLGTGVKVNADLTELRKLMKEKNIKYLESAPKNNFVTITLESPFTSRFVYAADLDNCKIVLNLENYNRPGPQLITYSPDKINEDLLDETAKFILGEPNKFSELSEYYF